MAWFLPSEVTSSFTSRTLFLFQKNFENKENAMQGVKRRSSEPIFNFKVDCLYCGKPAQLDYDTKSRITDRVVVRLIRSSDSARGILKQADKRNDDWGITLKGRINSVHCILAEKARYHDDCRASFFLTETPKRAKGRPKDPRKNEAFDKLCLELETADECQFSMTYLVNRLNEIGGKLYLVVRNLATLSAGLQFQPILYVCYLRTRKCFWPPILKRQTEGEIRFKCSHH